jgi:phosphate transport system permease protein
MMEWILRLSGLLTALTIVAILGFLVYFSAPLFTHGRVFEILSWDWRPFQGRFGILPMILGTVCLAVSSLIPAYVAAIGICCFAHGLGPRTPARVLMAVIHFMTGVPTVVYGFVAVFVLVPFIRALFAHGTGFSWLAASLTLSLLILPTIVLLIHAQLSTVDPAVRIACRSLGMSVSQEMLWVALPACSRGLFAGAILGMARAIGDTLVALMVSGNAPQVPHSFLDSIRTLTAHIALVVATDVHSSAYHSLFASGLILFLVSAAVSLGLRWIGSGVVPK